MVRHWVEVRRTDGEGEENEEEFPKSAHRRERGTEETSDSVFGVSGSPGRLCLESGHQAGAEGFQENKGEPAKQPSATRRDIARVQGKEVHESGIGVKEHLDVGSIDREVYSVCGGKSQCGVFFAVSAKLTISGEGRPSESKSSDRSTEGQNAGSFSGTDSTEAGRHVGGSLTQQDWGKARHVRTRGGRRAGRRMRAY